MASSVWYRAGTISIPANSKIVTGTNTKWGDSKQGIGAGQMLLIPGAGTVQLYEIASIDSDTQITLNDALVGAAISGSNYAIPIGLIGVKDTLVIQTVARLSYYQSQMDGWQQIMTGDGSVTLNAPDGTSVTISSFKKLTSDVASKADLTNGAVPLAQGGTGAKTKADAWAALATFGTAAGTAAQGNDARLGTVDNKTGGRITSGTTIVGAMQTTKVVASEVSQSSEMLFGTIYTGTTERARVGLDVGTSAAGDRVGRLYVGQDGTNKVWTFVYSSGSANAPGQWVNGSDRRFKTNIEPIENPLDKMRELRGCTWDRLDFTAKGIGFIAQEVQNVFPDSVYVNPYPTTLMDGTVLDETLSVDTSGVAAALHHQAILALMDKVEALENAVQSRDAALNEIQKRLKALDGLDA